MEENYFDKLFNQYFGDKNKRNEDGIAKMLNLMSKLNSGAVDNGESHLGPPDSVREFEKDGIIFEESSWTTELGTIVKISTKEDVEFTKDFFNKNDIPLGRTNKTVNKKEMSLEDQLKMAIKDENYEKACFLRDQINNVKNVDSENKVDDNDEWNF